MQTRTRAPHTHEHTSTQSLGLVRLDATICSIFLTPDRVAASALRGPLQQANFYEWNGKVYFQAKGDGDGGSELYVTDGTSAGTVMLKELAPGSTGGGPVRIHLAVKCTSTRSHAPVCSVRRHETTTISTFPSHAHSPIVPCPAYALPRPRLSSPPLTASCTSERKTAPMAPSSGRATARPPARSWSRTSGQGAQAAPRCACAMHACRLGAHEHPQPCSHAPKYALPRSPLSGGCFGRASLAGKSGSGRTAPTLPVSPPSHSTSNATSPSHATSNATSRVGGRVVGWCYCGHHCRVFCHRRDCRRDLLREGTIGEAGKSHENRSHPKPGVGLKH